MDNMLKPHIQRTQAEKEAGETHCSNLLTSMLDARDSGSGRGGRSRLSEDELLGNAKTFLLAGSGEALQLRDPNWPFACLKLALKAAAADEFRSPLFIG
jgi:hypothetical protein